MGRFTGWLRRSAFLGFLSTSNTLRPALSLRWGVSALALAALLTVLGAGAPRAAAQAARFSGVINTVGSGFTSPDSVAVDANGDVFVAEYDNSDVKEIIAGTGGAPAGTVNAGSAVHIVGSGFVHPQGVAVDAHGNVFVANEGNAVQEIVAGTGGAAAGTVNASSTVVTIGSGFVNPFGVAVDANGDVFVGDAGHQEVKEIVAGTGGAAAGTVNASSTVNVVGSGFTSPRGVAVNGSGDVFVADTVLAEVKEIVAGTGGAAAGTVNASSTVTSVGSGFQSPYGVAVDANGDVFVTDTQNEAVYEIAAGTGGAAAGAVNATSAVSQVGSVFSTPQGVAVDAGGNVFVANDNGDTVVEIAPGAVKFRAERVGGASAAQTLTFTFTAEGTLASTPYAVLTQGAPNLDFAPAAAQPSSVCVAGHDYVPGDTCTVSVTFGPRYPGLREGAVVLYGQTKAVIATGYVYGVGLGPLAVFPPGIISTVAGNGTQGYSGNGGSATSAELNAPTAVAVDGAGNLYIADRGNNRVREVNATTGIITTVAGNGTQGYSGDGGLATSAELDYPVAVAVDGAGNLYIADENNERIREVNAATGIITTVAGNGTQGYSGDGGSAISAELNEPTDVAVDGAGDLFIADASNNRIREVNAATGTISTVAGNGTLGYSGDGGPATSAALNYPLSVVIDARGDLYIVDEYNSRIREVNAATGTITTVAGNGTQGYSGDGGPATSAELNYPAAVSIGARGNLYIADAFNNRIREVNAATGIITTVAGDGTQGYSGDGGSATSAELNGPVAVAIDARGNLYVSDPGNNRIREVQETTPPSLSFASTAVGKTSSDSPQTVTLSNIGNQGLEFLLPTAAGDYNPMVSADFSYDNSSTCEQQGSSAVHPYVLAPGASCTMAIDFTPTAVGSISGSVVLYDESFTSALVHQVSTQVIPLSGSGVGPLTISPASGTVLPAGVLGVAYSQTLTASGGTGPYTFGSSGLPPGLQLSTSGVLSGTPTADGTYTINVVVTTPAGTVAATYTLTISKAVVTVTTPPTSASITYGQTLANSKLTGGSASVPGTFAWTTPTTTPGVGTTSYSATFTPTDSGAYAPVTTTVSVTVTPAPLTVTVKNAQKTYGALPPVFTSTVTGLVNGDTAASIGLAYSSPATATSAVGSYPINASITSKNYTLSATPGTLTVTPAALAVAVNGAARAYGAANPTFTGTVTGLVNGDTAASVGLAYSSTATATSAVGAYPISATITSKNYTLNATPGTLTVGKAVLTVTANSASRAYGAANPTFTGTVTGAVNGDTFIESFTTTATQTSAAGSYAIVPSVTGTNLGDYTVTAVNGTLTVTQGALTVTANNATRAYGAANPTFTGTVTGAINGNTFTESFTTTATMGSNAGSYAIVPSVTGADLSYYTVTAVNGALTVTKAASATALLTSVSSLAPGQSLTLTAHVTDASPGSAGTPTGTVTFYDGSTVLGTATLAGELASITTSTLSPGVTHSLTASYGGDTNFTASNSGAAISVPVTGSGNFNLNLTGSGSQTVVPGASAGYTFQVSPVGGTYPGPVSFSASGLPVGATATFSPATIAANGGPQTMTMTVQTTEATAKNHGGGLWRGGASVAFGLLLLPFFGTRKRKGWMRRLSVVLLLIGAGAFTTLATGCGTPNGFFGQKQQSYTVTVTATSGTVSKTAAVTLNVE